jgi:hypothetical protein
VRDSNTDEQVLVLDEGDAAAVGLFLDAQLLERLAAANPLEALHGGNLADYWTALEGRQPLHLSGLECGHDRGVSLLELELQAEIDKYVTSWWLLREQDPARYPAELHRLLFERAASTYGLRANAASCIGKPTSMPGASAAGWSGSCRRKWPPPSRYAGGAEALLPPEPRAQDDPYSTLSG